MPFVTRTFDESEQNDGVEVGIRVNIKYNLSHSFAAGDHEDSPDEKALDNAVAKVWDGENVIYNESLMDSMYDDSRDGSDSDSSDDDSEDERDDASLNHNDTRTVTTADVVQDNDGVSCYTMPSTMQEEPKVTPREIEHAEVYLDSALNKSKSGEDNVWKSDDEDIHNEQVNVVKSKEPIVPHEDSASASTVPEYENQDYFVSAISRMPSLQQPEEEEKKEEKEEEEEEADEDGSIAMIVEDKPPPLIEEAVVLQNEEHQHPGFSLDSSRWLEDLKHVLLLRDLFQTTSGKSSSNVGTNGATSMLEASDAMANKIKGFVRPLFDPGYESKRFYMDDDESSCSEDLSGYASLQEEDYYHHHHVKSRRRHRGGRRGRAASARRKKRRKHKRRRDHHHHDHDQSLRMASSMDSVLSEIIVVRQGEENIVNFLKKNLGVDLHDDSIDEGEYKDFVTTYFMDSSRLLNYERMSKHRQQHHPSSSSRRKSGGGSQGRPRRRSEPKSRSSKTAAGGSGDRTKSRRKHHDRHDHRKMEV